MPKTTASPPKRRAKETNPKRSGATKTADDRTLQSEINLVETLKRPSHPIWFWIIGSLLVPACFLLLVVLLKMFFWNPPTISGASHPAIWFCGGIFLFALAYFLLPRKYLLITYVAGHEWTHWLFVKLFLGKTGEISITSRGGWIMTSKTNWLINLSPYLLPFWALMGACLYLPLSIWLNWDKPHIYQFYNHDILVDWLLVSQIFLGFFVAFHVFYTCRMINRHQPDLHDQGTFFSLILIVFVNLLIMNLLYLGISGSMSFQKWVSLIKESMNPGLLSGSIDPVPQQAISPELLRVDQ